MIITGPNASGKTTFLKTTAINLIFSQQFGVGYYSDCCIVPYTHFHSYLNIPDTSGRDSLFQAESRRCKEILDIIKTTNKYTDKHFCIFDELYSGTNPIEATKSAYAFLKYLSKTYVENVDFLLTTHYVSICDKWNKKKDIIQNYRMGVIAKSKDTYQFTYKIEPGISKIQGALQILEDMSYPDEIIDTIRGDNF
jgi:DNA mismatch repair protein MutS